MYHIIKSLCVCMCFCLSLTCVLSKLVHGLQINDVRRELAIHLPQHHTSPGIPLQHILNMVADGRAVGPPAPVFVQPLPDHHPSHVLRGVAQTTDGHHQPGSWTSHLLCGVHAQLLSVS